MGCLCPFRGGGDDLRLILVIITQAWWLILVGIGCIMAAWGGYTGGKNPYGYLGLGDVFVFVFFGLVATLGTTYTQPGRSASPRSSVRSAPDSLPVHC